jgi:RNA polymerase sigma factor (sigma-70 family)
MDVNYEKLIKTKEFLDHIALSIRNIVYSKFPGISVEEREDVEQDVKLKLWRMISGGKKIDNFRSYIWKVVITTTLDVIEERLHCEPDDVIAQEANAIPFHRLHELSPEQQLEQKEMKKSVRLAVASLPSRRKQVVELWLTDMNLEEIAEFLRWKENQVRHLLYRGIEDVKGILSKMMNRAPGKLDREQSSDAGK